MTLQALLILAMQLSIIATIFGFGLEASLSDLLSVLNRPGLLLRSVLAMFVITPVLAVSLAQHFDFPDAIEVALVALALSPIPPLLPRKEGQAGGHAPFALGLMVSMALLSIAVVPLATWVLGGIYQRTFSMALGPIVLLIGKVIIVPLGAGILLRSRRPALAQRLARPVQLVATVVLIAAALVIAAGSWQLIWAQIGNGTLVAILLFIAAGLLVGHLLGGPKPEDRTVLALSTSSRHPGIAIAMATANFPGNHDIPASILLYLLVNIVVSIPYIMWRKRQGAGPRTRSP